MRYLTYSMTLLTAFFASAIFGIDISEATPINVQILSATVKDQKIEGATAILQKDGEQSVTATSNPQGQVSLNASFADDSSTLLIIKKPGYSNLIVKCPCAGMTYAISTVMDNLDGIRIVLNWREWPKDLDSHLSYQPAQDVYWKNPQGEDAQLDVDDRNGYGPETITINRKQDGKHYIYAVNDYSNATTPDSDELTNSDAKVFIYAGQTLIKTYYVPKNVKGNLWIVFVITESGEIQDINSLIGMSGDVHIGIPDFKETANRNRTRTNIFSMENQEHVRNLNKQGEEAYHAGDLEESIRLYQEAIELDENYGQAYSNLGLSFQKAGRVAEAMWANRKAIALAIGPTAATVRASSHFNNGKIYEAAGQWSDALREYQYAKNEKANPVYDKAILRMQQKAGH